MKRMTQLKVDARKALGPYGAQSTASIPWCIGNIVKGLVDERQTTEAYIHTVKRRDQDIKDLFAQFKTLDLGDDPEGMGTRMVSNEGYERLGLMFKRIVEQL